MSSRPRASGRSRALTPEATLDALSRYRAFLAKEAPAAGIEEWLDAPMLAHSEAPAAAGRFPLLLVAAGMGGALPDQAALAESLASHGYVVATTPSPVRLGAKMESEADVPAMAEEQARDLEVALQVLSPRGMVDAARAGVIGYSFGSRPALLLAGRRPALRALVSLDGGIGSATAKGWLPRARWIARACARRSSTSTRRKTRTPSPISSCWPRSRGRRACWPAWTGSATSTS